MPITPKNASLTSVLVINLDFHSVLCTFPMYASLIALDITAALLFFGNCFELRVICNCFELRIIYYSDVMFGVQIPASLRAFCFVACQRCGCGGVSPVFFIAEQRVNRTGAPTLFSCGRWDASLFQFAADGNDAIALKVQIIDQLDRLCLFRDNHEIAIFVFFIAVASA